MYTSITTFIMITIIVDVDSDSQRWAASIKSTDKLDFAEEWTELAAGKNKSTIFPIFRHRLTIVVKVVAFFEVTSVEMVQFIEVIPFGRLVSTWADLKFHDSTRLKHDMSSLAHYLKQPNKFTAKSNCQSKATIFTDSTMVTYRTSFGCFATALGQYMAARDCSLPKDIAKRIALIAFLDNRSHWVAGNTDTIQIKQASTTGIANIESAGVAVSTMACNSRVLTTGAEITISRIWSSQRMSSTLLPYRLLRYLH